MIRFSPEECCDPDFAGSREWLETNGIGGFASSTIIGLNTRKYHGLLVAATQPPVGRMLLLSKLETVLVDGRRFELRKSVSRSHLSEGLPVSKRVPARSVSLSLYMAWTKWNSRNGFFLFMTRIRWLWSMNYVGPRECQIEIRPLIAFRDYHSLTHRNSALNPEVRNEANVATVHPYERVWHRSISPTMPMRFCPRQLVSQLRVQTGARPRLRLSGRPVQPFCGAVQWRDADAVLHGREESAERRRN